ncbi:MAG: hypothetical protein ACK5P5_03110 [Pseudobdellovibrionaceae bacterium]
MSAVIILLLCLFSFARSTAYSDQSQPKVLIVSSREDWARWKLNHSVFVDWQIFSEVGAISRGILNPNLNQIKDHFEALGLSKTQQIFVIGRGLKGLGEEGRMLWILKSFGFEKAAIISKKSSVFKDLQKEASSKNLLQPKRSRLKKVLFNSKWSISRFELEKNKNDYFFLDVRPLSHNKYPLFFSDIQSIRRIDWRSFYFNDLLPREFLREQIKEDFQKSGKTKIIILSHAGLAAAGIALLLDRWNLPTVFLPGGLVSLQPDFFH